MTITTKFDIRQMVYLVHDPEQLKRSVVEINVISAKMHLYLLRCGTEESWHYEYELSNEKDNSFI